jgi:hypothetical protein
MNMKDYNPTNTAAAKCPATNTEWAAVATPLPPTANKDACSCMMDTLSCVVNSGKVDEKKYGDLFGTVCGYKDGKYCAGINKNMTMGGYGAYGMCNSTEQLSFALNQYYKDNQQSNDGCNFKGQAMKKAAASSTPSACAGLLKQAGADGTGTVTSAPTSTGGSSSGGSGGKGGSTTGAAAGLVIPKFESGLIGLSFYIGAAVMSGMAMILL